MSFRKAAIALIALALSSPSLGQHWTDFVLLDPRTAESGRPYLTAPQHQLDDPVSQALLADTPFQKYLTYQRYRVVVGDAPPYEGGFVHGPGHHISAIAALVFDPHGTPYATLKSGDTRLARALRAEPYVATSGIAGRWDKKGASAADIVLGELAEEIGGHPIEGTFRRLGDSLSPTMPFESTESDEYFTAAVKIDASPYGDGGQMEVVGLIGPVFLDPTAAIMAMDSGEISDAARARTMFGRAWDAIGYLPDLGMYVHDFPELENRFDTLGLGPANDPRELAAASAIPPERAPDGTLASKVNSVKVDSIHRIPLGEDLEMVDARIQHAAWDGAKQVSLPPVFSSQYLRTDYDRAKVAVYYLDPKNGPMVEMTPQARPALAFAPGEPKVVRRDLRDLKVAKLAKNRERPFIVPDRATPLLQTDWVRQAVGNPCAGLPHRLAQHSAASSGQSDLFYWSYSCRIDPPEASDRKNFFTLADAIRLCRSGHGDAQSEATLLRLATHLDWLPQLGMARSTVYLRTNPVGKGR